MYVFNTLSKLDICLDLKMHLDFKKVYSQNIDFIIISYYILY